MLTYLNKNTTDILAANPKMLEDWNALKAKNRFDGSHGFSNEKGLSLQETLKTLGQPKARRYIYQKVP
jgi:hypothetical protein